MFQWSVSLLLRAIHSLAKTFEVSFEQLNVSGNGGEVQQYYDDQHDDADDQGRGANAGGARRVHCRRLILFAHGLQLLGNLCKKQWR